jgi:hypothetical protein
MLTIKSEIEVSTTEALRSNFSIMSDANLPQSSLMVIFGSGSDLDSINKLIIRQILVADP